MKVLTDKQLREESEELKLKQALFKDMEQFVQSMPSDDDTSHTIPDKISERAYQKVRTQKKLRRVAIAMLIMFLFVAPPISAQAFKPWIFEFIGTLTGDAYFHPQHNVDFNWEGICVPQKIPKEFSLLGKSRSKDHILLQFEKEGGQFIYFYQGTRISSGILDTENAELTEPVTVNKHQGVHMQNKNVHTILWDGDTDSYALRSNISYSELLGIAQSVNENECEE